MIRNSIYYEPKISSKVTPADCINNLQYDTFLKQIQQDKNLSVEESTMLKLLATRFLDFNYKKIADYYACTNMNMQRWLEKLRCVIVDEDKAIANGYIEFLRDYKINVQGKLINHE